MDDETDEPGQAQVLVEVLDLTGNVLASQTFTMPPLAPMLYPVADLGAGSLDNATLRFTMLEGAGIFGASVVDMLSNDPTTREAHWIQNFDSGYDSSIWHSLDWLATIPANTGVEVTLVGGNTEAELTTNPSAPCGPLTSSPVDLVSSCGEIHGHRWLSMDFRLTTLVDGTRPSLNRVELSWSR